MISNFNKDPPSSEENVKHNQVIHSLSPSLMTVRPLKKCLFPVGEPKRNRVGRSAIIFFYLYFFPSALVFEEKN